MRDGQVVACCGAIIVTVVLSSMASTLPERKSYLSPFQDAWKAFLQTSVFVLYQRSFERDLLLGGDGQCFHGRNTECNHEEKYCFAETYYWDNATAKIIKKPVYAYPEATPGYEVPNAMAVSPYKGKLVSIYYPFVVSEYNNCDILRSPRHDNGCELWVTRQGAQNVSSACLFIYDLLCGPNKFQKYDEEFCRDKIQIT
ncbi:uncharacterized protein LOC142572969 isoform X1 [Dermacentor variabilis]|uniref:uncharacterized protein LOC142572969 isoform X1 n=1 Tax=Dermacentor variabilis TaxID=34621 RepID=UPI003F5B9052